jgi:penicillin-binding protein 1B
VSVWVGRDDNQPAGLTGANGALQLFGDYMSRRGVNSLRLAVPKGIVWANFSRGGKPVASGCAGSLSLPARLDQLGPTEACSSGGDAQPDNPIDWFKQLFSLHGGTIPERG